MSSPPLPRHARTPTLPTTASTCLLRRPRGRFLLVRGSSGAAAAAASPGLSCSHYSVGAPHSPRASSSTYPRRSASGDLVVLTVTASAVAVSACLVFFSAIRSMLAYKREAEFLEKYFDSAREKLPETMASVRLVGRDVGGLAADLSDIRLKSLNEKKGEQSIFEARVQFYHKFFPDRCILMNIATCQELTKGVKSSMSIVHTAEAQLCQLTPSALPGPARRMSSQKNRVEEPLLASTVRDLRELVADIRSGFGAAFGMTGLFMWVSNFGSQRHKNSL